MDGEEGVDADRFAPDTRGGMAPVDVGPRGHARGLGRGRHIGRRPYRTFADRLHHGSCRCVPDPGRSPEPPPGWRPPGRLRLLARRSATAGRRRDPGPGGSPVLVPSRRRSGGRAPRPVAARPRRRLRRVHPRDAGRAHAASAPSHALGQDRGGWNGPRPHCPLRPRSDPGAVSPARALWREQPRHRPRRAMVLRRARRGPHARPGRPALRDPASPDGDGAAHRAAPRRCPCPPRLGRDGAVPGRPRPGRRRTAASHPPASPAPPRVPANRPAPRTNGPRWRRGPRCDRRGAAALGDPKPPWPISMSGGPPARSRLP